MKMARPRIPANVIALAFLTLGAGVALMATSGTLRASVDAGFDPAKHVQLNAGGIMVTWVSADDEDGVVEWAAERRRSCQQGRCLPLPQERGSYSS